MYGGERARKKIQLRTDHSSLMTPIIYMNNPFGLQQLQRGIEIYALPIKPYFLLAAGSM